MPLKLDMPIMPMKMEVEPAKQEQSVNAPQSNAPSRALDRALNYVVSQFEDDLAAQALVFGRMEESVARLEKSLTRVSHAMVAIGDRLAAASDRLSEKTTASAHAMVRRVDDNTKAMAKQIDELKSGLVSVGTALKSHIETVSGDLRGSLNPRSDFDAIRKELNKLNDIMGGLKDHKKAVAKLALDGSDRKRALEDHGNTIFAMLEEISAKLNPPKKSQEPSKKDDAIVAELRAYMSAEKKLIRDENGDLIGWKLNRTNH